MQFLKVQIITPPYHILFFYSYISYLTPRAKQPKCLPFEARLRLGQKGMEQKTIKKKTLHIYLNAEFWNIEPQSER